MKNNDILTLLALIIIPIFAVVVAQWLQNRSEKRKDKMQIFRTLMTSRIGWSMEKSYALNTIDIVFANDKAVRAEWKDLYDKYCVVNPDEQQQKKIQQAEYKLLETMAVSLGYKDKITWETIQNPYMPQGMINQINNQTMTQKAYSDLLFKINQNLPTAQTEKTEEE